MSYEAGVKQAYYADLYLYVKTKTSRSRTMAINPGIPGIDETYMQACDITMNYEIQQAPTPAHRSRPVGGQLPRFPVLALHP